MQQRIIDPPKRPVASVTNAAYIRANAKSLNLFKEVDFLLNGRSTYSLISMD